MPLSIPPEPAPPAPAVELAGIDKHFGPVQACRDVSLSIAAGTIHGLIGENGAGKSTLMNILYGLYPPDAGDIRLHGRPVRIGSPADAIAARLGMVHQHFMLVDAFTVLDNLLLGREGGWHLGRARDRLRADLADLSGRFGLDLPLDAVTGDLPVGIRQRIEIVKALLRDADTLILDEPTAVLTPAEVEGLFALLRALKAEGHTIVLITHKLKEVMAVTDAVTVLRHGAVAGRFVTAATTEDQLAEAMTGRRPVVGERRLAPPRGALRLRAEGLAAADESGVLRLADASLSLHAGEIVGIAGVAGSGQTELLQVLAGMRPFSKGRLTVDGRAYRPGSPPDPARLRRAGLAHIPEDRLRHGVVKEFSAAENLIFGRHRDPAWGPGPWLDWRRITAAAAALMERADVRPRLPGQRLGRFSGGNQQKLVVGRELDGAPAILLVGQPTRGVDLGAARFIHDRLRACRDAGAAILLVSSDLDELLELSDRILVLHAGRIAGELDGAAADERTVGRLMAGLGPGEAA